MKRSKVIESYAMSGCTSISQSWNRSWWWELTLECGHAATRTKGAVRHLDKTKDKASPKFVYCEYCETNKE